MCDVVGRVRLSKAIDTRHKGTRLQRHLADLGTRTLLIRAQGAKTLGYPCSNGH